MDVRVVIAVSITVVSLLQVVKNNMLFCQLNILIPYFIDSNFQI